MSAKCIVFLCILSAFGQQLSVYAQISSFLENTTYTPEGVFKLLNFFKTRNISALEAPDSNVIITTTVPPTVIPRVKEHECGQRLIRHKALIMGGENTTAGDWPWHVALYRVTNRQSSYICGGTLISETRVVTAGHCVVESGSIILAERLLAYLGKYKLAGGDNFIQEKSVYDIILHPHYTKNPLLNDIAVLKLSSKVTYTDYVQPICLWKKSKEKEDIFDKMGTVVGWGFTENNQLATHLLKATLPVVQDFTCLKSKPSFFNVYLTDKTFCVGYRDGVNACNGDSGSGFFMSEVDENGENSTWFLRGIVSLSVSRKDTHLCDPHEYTLFTDAAKYLNFINENF